MTIQNLLEWQNLIFVCPMLLAFVLLGVSLFGGTNDHDMSADHDVSIDHDVSLDHDVSVDHDVGSGQGSSNALPHDFAHDVDTDHETSIINTMLSALGIGRTPLSIIGFCWLMIFGFVGLSLNQLWVGVFGSINILVLVSAGVALLSALTLTSLIARLLGKIIPQTESYGEHLSDFINREAEVRYTVTATSGTIILRDKTGNLQTLPVRRDVSCLQDIPPDTKVLILSYSQQEREFVVIPAKQIINN